MCRQTASGSHRSTYSIVSNVNTSAALPPQQSSQERRQNKVATLVQLFQLGTSVTMMQDSFKKEWTCSLDIQFSTLLFLGERSRGSSCKVTMAKGRAEWHRMHFSLAFQSFVSQKCPKRPSPRASTSSSSSGIFKHSQANQEKGQRLSTRGPVNHGTHKFVTH